jgi:1,4-alpha-glucan branching enzyme
MTDLFLPPKTGSPDQPVSICEFDSRSLPFAANPDMLVDFLRRMGFTHLKLPQNTGEFQKIIEAVQEAHVPVAVEGDSRMEGIAVRYKNNVRWASDTLAYFAHDPLYRAHHHNLLSAAPDSAPAGNLVLPLGSEYGPLAARMPGDEWQKLANLRLLYGYMMAYPGKKLLFMGGEFQAPPEFRQSGLPRWVRDLNTFYRGRPALFELDAGPGGFAWVDPNDSQRSILAFRRIGRNPREQVLFVLNFTPVPRQNYRVGVPEHGEWREMLNSDATLYGGSGQGNLGGVRSSPVPMHGFPDSLNLTLPPLAMLAFHKAAEGTT